MNESLCKFALEWCVQAQHIITWKTGMKRWRWQGQTHGSCCLHFQIDFFPCIDVDHGVIQDPGSDHTVYFCSSNTIVSVCSSFVLLLYWGGIITHQKTTAEEDLVPTFLNPNFMHQFLFGAWGGQSGSNNAWVRFSNKMLEKAMGQQK